MVAAENDEKETGKRSLNFSLFLLIAFGRVVPSHYMEQHTYQTAMDDFGVVVPF